MTQYAFSIEPPNSIIQCNFVGNPNQYAVIIFEVPQNPSGELVIQNEFLLTYSNKDVYDSVCIPCMQKGSQITVTIFEYSNGDTQKCSVSGGENNKNYWTILGETPVNGSPNPFVTCGIYDDGPDF